MMPRTGDGRGLPSREGSVQSAGMQKGWRTICMRASPDEPVVLPTTSR